VISGNIAEQVNKIRNEPGRDIWLFGGAALTTSMMNLGLVDEIWLAVHPILLGSGKYCFSHLDHRVHLDLVETKPYSTGLVSLTYTVGP
jgi:dihydrofolate reductase